MTWLFDIPKNAWKGVLSFLLVAYFVIALALSIVVSIVYFLFEKRHGKRRD